MQGKTKVSCTLVPGLARLVALLHKLAEGRLRQDAPGCQPRGTGTACSFEARPQRQAALIRPEDASVLGVLEQVGVLWAHYLRTCTERLCQAVVQ